MIYCDFNVAVLVEEKWHRKFINVVFRIINDWKKKLKDKKKMREKVEKF